MVRGAPIPGPERRVGFGGRDMKDEEAPEHDSRASPTRVFAPTFVHHRGMFVLKFDFSHLQPAELTEALGRASQLIAERPPRCLRILTLFDSRLDESSGEALKRYAFTNGLLVRAEAVLASGYWRVVVTSLKLRYGRNDLVLFGDETLALDWLTAI
jgi:hypothetical protein